MDHLPYVQLRSRRYTQGGRRIRDRSVRNRSCLSRSVRCLRHHKWACLLLLLSVGAGKYIHRTTSICWCRMHVHCRLQRKKITDPWIYPVSTQETFLHCKIRRTLRGPWYDKSKVVKRRLQGWPVDLRWWRKNWSARGSEATKCQGKLVEKGAWGANNFGLLRIRRLIRQHWKRAGPK